MHFWILSLLLCAVPYSTEAGFIGRFSNNPYQPEVLSPYDALSVQNPYGPYGSPYSNTSAHNPYATDAPKLYDSEGHYRGKLSSNPFDPDSVSNPYGRYGNPFSPDSLNNPFGAGSRFRPDSPNNPYGSGWLIEVD